jgi:hypothetical protein
MDSFYHRLEELFKSKTEEAHRIVNTEDDEALKVSLGPAIPFEVSKVLHQIQQETERREKLFKKKDA